MATTAILPTMTDWDKELAKIDKQLASISDEQLLAEAKAPPAKGGTGITRSPVMDAKMAGQGGSAKAVPAAPSSAAVAPGRSWVAWMKVLVAVGAAAGLMFWPWPARCGLPLVGFTAATGGVALLGIWGAVGSWRHRLGLAHVASLLVTAWGLALGAREVLPRVGYAVPTAERAASWSCEGLPAAPGTAPITTPNATPNATPVTPAPAAGGTVL